MRLFKNLFKKKEIEQSAEIKEELVEQILDVEEKLDVEDVITNPDIKEELETVIDSVEDMLNLKADFELQINDLNSKIDVLMGTIESKDNSILEITNQFNEIKNANEELENKLAEVEKDNDKKITLEVARICTSQGLPVEALPEMQLSEPTSILDKARKLKGRELVNYFEKNQQELYDLMKESK